MSDAQKRDIGGALAWRLCLSTKFRSNIAWEVRNCLKLLRR
jgi:hypothetical protein